MNNQEELKKAIEGVGATKIIYSLVTPETEAVKRAVFKGNQQAEFERTLAAGGSLVDADALVKASDRADADYFATHREGWTQKQDANPGAFFERWLDWTKPIAPVDGKEFRFRYPTSGGSEALRALTDEYGNRARRDGFKPEVHLFAGEYEGFNAYAKAAYIPIVIHDRDRWPEAVEAIAKASKDKPVLIPLSHPSALDGNVWKDYDGFMTALADKAPKAEVMLDLTYVGCITKDAHIRTDYPNIPAVVFSLSKPAGAYYNRIGGVVARSNPKNENNEAFPSLFGTKWMNNIDSLAIGTEFMKRHGVHDIPRKYAQVQLKAMEQVGKALSLQGHPITLKPADVFMLASAEMPENPTPLQNYLSREADGKKIIRVCLTPTMGEMIGMAKTHEVTPRYYERL